MLQSVQLINESSDSYATSFSSVLLTIQTPSTCTSWWVAVGVVPEFIFNLHIHLAVGLAVAVRGDCLCGTWTAACHTDSGQLLVSGLAGTDAADGAGGAPHLAHTQHCAAHWTWLRLALNEQRSSKAKGLQ